MFRIARAYGATNTTQIYRGSAACSRPILCTVSTRQANVVYHQVCRKYAEIYKWQGKREVGPLWFNRPGPCRPLYYPWHAVLAIPQNCTWSWAYSTSNRTVQTTFASHTGMPKYIYISKYIYIYTRDAKRFPWGPRVPHVSKLECVALKKTRCSAHRKPDVLFVVRVQYRACIGKAKTTIDIKKKEVK